MNSNSSSATALFACSRCFTRHPFEELSAGQQLCKECRGAFPIVKCTFCRSEFQQSTKGSTSTICKKCEQNVIQYGKPSACKYCNIIAAFINNKCQRCSNSEKKYGPPVTCEQCKQKCAFDRKDDDKKVDGKLLCWLCTLSYKRTLAKTKQTQAERHKMQQKERKDKVGHYKHKRPHRVDVTKMPGEPPVKVQKGPPTPITEIDPTSSDHVVAMTQLKEKIASMQKQLQQKDASLFSKDKQITELKAKHFTVEQELRAKMKSMQKDHDNKTEQMQIKMKSMQKELAVLSRSKGKGVLSKEIAAGSGSGTDSPSLA
ncbi:protein FAM76A [Cloeon dipterum]|uniref:Protein FAM76A n=1 Tax=Cloeon dipterum TaxID=197152 RepID=A0A8S1C1B3_9INSE|nr:Hypothetical predicted protein [Cloeon dipterum]